MAGKISITAENVYKDFKLPHQRKNTIKSVFTSAVRSVFEKNTFEVQHALRGVSFEIGEGEFFGIVGRNGSGKSTLLKMLAGIYQPTGGTLNTVGKLVPFIELGVGFNPELTGRQNVFLNGALLGFSRKEISAMYDDIVEFAELEKFMDQKLKNYSSGMQVRLAFSMAIRADADILLVDEVLAVGDADFQRKCYEYFKHLKKLKKTVVFVTHDMQAVREYCDRAILIEKGVIADEGDANRVAQSYTQMFMKKEDGKEDPYAENKEADRWGTKEIVYSGAPKVSVGDKSIIIDAEVKARTDNLEDVVCGFTVVSLDGENVMGTNSRVKELKIPSMKKGSKLSLHWEFPNILEDGKYGLSVTAHGASGLPVYDWWNGSAIIDIRKKERTGYKVNPDIVLEVSEKK